MAMQSDHEFAPTEIARTVFPTAFRGYDQDAVRRYLSRLAAALEHHQAFDDLEALETREADDERIEELETEVATLQEEIRELETELVQRSVDEADQGSRQASDAAEFDEHRAIELLGQETARVLESARSAAADILKRAENQAVTLKNESKKELADARREAKRLVAEKRAEAEAAIDELTEQAERSANRITTEAEEHRAAAVEESAEILADAERQAEAEQAGAQQRARQIVADAEALRHQVVAELVADRRAATGEVDLLVEARDRLAAALTSARSELDHLGDELARATSDGRGRNDGSAVEVDGDEVARLIDRLDAGTAGIETTDGVDPAPAVPSPRRSTIDEPTEELPAVAAEAIAVGPADVDELVDDVIDDVIDAPGSAGVFDIDSLDRATVDDDPELTELELELGLDAESDGLSALDDDDLIDLRDVDLDGPESDDQLNEAPLDGTSLSLVEGFSTIVLDDGDTSPAPVGNGNRGNGHTNGHVDAASAVDGGGVGPVGVLVEESADPTDIVTTVAGRVNGGTSNRTQGDLLLDRPPSGKLPAVFAARDVAVTRAGANLKRQLRRALNDDQSDVLDRLRQGRGAITLDELRPIDEQIEHYVGPLRRGLTDIVTAGARAGGCDQAEPGSLENLVDQLASFVVDRVRTPTTMAITEADHRDRERILEPIRSGYRDVRNIGLPDLLVDALNEAFAIGLYDSIEEGAPVAWLVDPRTDPDPVNEVNRDRTGLVKGEPFPSGHVRPLSVPGCRCLVVQA